MSVGAVVLPAALPVAGYAAGVAAVVDVAELDACTAVLDACAAVLEEAKLLDACPVAAPAAVRTGVPLLVPVLLFAALPVEPAAADCDAVLEPALPALLDASSPAALVLLALLLAGLQPADDPSSALSLLALPPLGLASSLAMKGTTVEATEGLGLAAVRSLAGGLAGAAAAETGAAVPDACCAAAPAGGLTGAAADTGPALADA